jgi:hypothetical protein
VLLLSPAESESRRRNRRRESEIRSGVEIAEKRRCG